MDSKLAMGNLRKHPKGRGDGEHFHPVVGSPADFRRRAERRARISQLPVAVVVLCVLAVAEHLHRRRRRASRGVYRRSQCAYRACRKLRCVP